MDGSLKVASIDVKPVSRSGPVVRFPVERAYAATLRLAQRGGTPVPAGAQVTIGEVAFPVARDGLLYVEGLKVETVVNVDWQGGACTFQAARPDGHDPVPDLGTVTCE